MKDLQDLVWKEKVFSVLTLLRLAIDQSEKERIRLQDDLARNLSLLHSQQESLVALQSTVVEAIEEYRSNDAMLNLRLNNLEMIIGDMQRRADSSFRQMSDRLMLFEGGLTDGRDKGISKNWFKELKELKTFVAKESVRASDLWQEHSQRFNDLKLELEMRCKDSKDLMSKHDTLSRKLEQFAEEIFKCSESSAKQKSDLKGLKFQMRENLKYIEELITESCRPEVPPLSSFSSCSCAEGISTNGRIIWRIDRYKEKMIEAREKDRALYSPIFYDKEYGYTLRMELFLNGKGQWKDRHIIGCLRVENGKWDPLLDWPCVLRAVVILRDQDNPARDVRKLVKTIGRDRDSNEPDKESGLYMFVPYTTLSRHPGYIKNNVMFLDVQVKDIRTSASMMSLTVQ